MSRHKSQFARSTLLAVIACLWTTALSAHPLLHLRGDANNDGRVSLADGLVLHSWLKNAGAPPPCEAAADADGSGDINIQDTIFLFRFVFNGLVPPPAPFPECGEVNTELPCDVEPQCTEKLRAPPGPFVISADAAGAEEGLLQVEGRAISPIDIEFELNVEGSDIIAWSAGVDVASPASLPVLSTAATVSASADSDPVGRVESGISWVERIGASQAYIAVITDLLREKKLPEGRHTILRGTARVTVPTDPAGVRFVISPSRDVVAGERVITLEVGVPGQSFSPEIRPLVVEVRPIDRSRLFVRGDYDRSGSFSLGDSIDILSFLFTGFWEPACLDAADVNDDGVVNMTDAIHGLHWLFLGGPGIPPPTECGVDPTPDSMETCRFDDGGC